MPRRRPPAGLRSDEATSMVVLMEELVEEILLRFPPAEPASLVRAALVCKPWCRLISGRRFRRRFSEVHRSPPMLGYFCNLYPDAGNPNRNKDAGPVSRFFPASAAYPRHPDQANWSALDARHGRVLLRSVRGNPRISVWDPFTGERWELPPLSDTWYEDDEDHWNAAVLCAATGGGGCDHLDCRGKPFLVVYDLLVHLLVGDWLLERANLCCSET
ncbi:hypothetical protein HU200_005771 [Digitaria exilis]|uniref:F-box domain-containing protein n=1 Tax=Digitaria exilis TaxID=1010633 RepID=A0A835KTZ1_9POAL|nr:hypothetical protein HU200_005771 [Digitaria exilis]